MTTRSHEDDLRNMSKMPQELHSELREWHDKELASLIELLRRWPAFRRQIAYVLLGHAVGTIDMMGGDADGFLRFLRSKEPIPEPLPPPEEPS